MKHHEIDNAVRDWAAGHEPTPEHLRALQAKIIQRYRQEMPVPAEWPPQTAPRSHKLLYFAAGVAATLVAVAAWSIVARHREDNTALLREEGGLFAGRKLAMSRVFGETERLFGTNLQWVAQSGRKADLGLVDDPTGSGKAMIVHVSVLARRVSEGRQWRRVWEADVVARTDGVVELTPGDMAGNRMSLWLHRLDDGKAFVESRLELRSPVKMDVETSEVLKFGVSRGVTRIRNGDTEYVLLQTVAPASGEPCAS